MLKPLRLGMVPHSKLSHLTTLLPGGTLVCSLMILSVAGLSGCARHMPLVLDPNRPVGTGAGGGGIGNRCPARHWERPHAPSPSPSYSSMNLRRMSSDAASGFPSLFITVILRMPVMASVIFCSVACICCCCASILW